MFIEWFPTKTCVVVSKEGVSILYNYGFQLFIVHLKKSGGVKLGELWCLTPWLSCFIGGVYRENRRPATSVTNFINNVVSSNKGILIADTCVYIHTTVYKFKEHTPKYIITEYRNKT